MQAIKRVLWYTPLSEWYDTPFYQGVMVHPSIRVLCCTLLSLLLTIFYKHYKFLITSKPNLSLYLPYYAEACNEFVVLISASYNAKATQLLAYRCWSGGEPFATLCKIWPVWD